MIQHEHNDEKCRKAVRADGVKICRHHKLPLEPAPNEVLATIGDPSNPLGPQTKDWFKCPLSKALFDFPQGT